MKRPERKTIDELARALDGFWLDLRNADQPDPADTDGGEPDGAARDDQNVPGRFFVPDSADDLVPEVPPQAGNWMSAPGGAQDLTDILPPIGPDGV